MPKTERPLLPSSQPLPRLGALLGGLALFAATPSVWAGPGIEKKGGGSPSPSSSSSSTGNGDSAARGAAMQKLEQAEGLVQANDGDKLVQGLTLMLEAYIELEKTDGAEASGVKELRSWLVKAFETAGLADEAKTLRGRGSYVDHPLSVMPSTWFRSAPAASSSGGGSLDGALEDFSKGLDMLKEGNIDGLGLLLEAYEVIERETGAESEESKLLRSFIVGFLETGGFNEEAAQLRKRGSVATPTDKDKEVYVATWAKVLEAQQSAGGISSMSSDGFKGAGSSGSSGSSGSGSSSGSSSSSSWGSGSSSDGSSDGSSESSNDSSNDSSNSGDDDDDRKRRRKRDGSSAFEKGSPIPTVLLDFGVGSWRPETGDKGFIWTVGLGVSWRLFSVKFFGMQLGAYGLIGRNRDKRWLTDTGATLGLPFDFGKFYITPLAGGGYDGLTGKGRADSLRIADNPYYDFGGVLGVRFAERFSIYGGAMRVNRIDEVLTNETRVRVGFGAGFDKGAVDLSFVFQDYESSADGGGARLYTGNVGARF